MYDTHTCADGRQLLIVDMTDMHLLNTIGMHCRNLSQIRETLEQSQKYDSDILFSALSDFNMKDLKASAKLTIKKTHEMLKSYVFEAACRNLNVSLMLNTAYGRVTKELPPTIEDFPF